MDRLGSIALVASLVLLSALHMLSAPMYLNALPALLFFGGLARLALARKASAPEFPLSEG